MSITKAAKELEDEASKIIPWNLIKEQNQGEKVEYTDKEKVLVEAIKSYGLEDKALTQGVGLVFTSDSTDFSCQRGHTTIGFCMVDIDAKQPGSNKHIFKDGLDQHGNRKFNSYYHTK